MCKGKKMSLFFWMKKFVVRPNFGICFPNSHPTRIFFPDILEKVFVNLHASFKK